MLRTAYDPNAFSGFTNSRDFVLGNGKALIWLSQLAYEIDNQNMMPDTWGLHLVGKPIDVMVLSTANTRCLVATGHDATFVAFAGTNPRVLANWITDFDAHIDKSQTAQGYQVAADSVWPQVANAISGVAPSGRKVFVTGHSLGGALAVLTALRIKKENLADVLAVYTFGMPRPGTKMYADEYNGCLGSYTYRLAHGDDVVTSVAPSLLGYHHVGRYLRCERGGKFDPARLSKDTSSDEAQFIATVVEELRDIAWDRVTRLAAPPAGLAHAATLAVGAGAAGTRTDPDGVAIELLPPRLRDHLSDCYIGAF
jgi:triacylglycerol lipase